MLERNDLMEQRLAKIAAVVEAGQQAYPNDFKPSHTGAELIAGLADQLAPHPIERATGTAAVRMVGRVIAINRKGKVGFLRIRDRSASAVIAARQAANVAREAANMAPRDSDTSTYQVFFRRNEDEDLFDALLKSGQSLDVGDIVGCIGLPFRTQTGEPSLWATSLDAEGNPLSGTAAGEPCVRILTKSIRLLPEKFHGLTDKQTRYRQRYVDLIVNDDVRATFERRAHIIAAIRAFFHTRDYLEVETPMMHSIVGGATARPFATHHNALGIPLFLRVAPELHLKRLVVGGLERVFEINRNFRNEGIDLQHNPEFTMLEFYEAYATYTDLMVLIEQLFSGLAQQLHGTTDLVWGDANDPDAQQQISMAAPFARISVYEGIQRWGGLDAEQLHDAALLRAKLAEQGITLPAATPVGKLQMALFETVAEPHLIQPTFVTDFPVEVSPLSRKKDSDPRLTDRFEMYMAGFEIANAFSELNDSVDQHERFQAQSLAKAGGDVEAMDMDMDYIRALEYGLPPTAGCGIGIDRLVMVLTNNQSIREVILFPLLRPEQRRSESGDAATPAALTEG